MDKHQNKQGGHKHLFVINTAEHSGSTTFNIMISSIFQTGSLVLTLLKCPCAPQLLQPFKYRQLVPSWCPKFCNVG